MEGGGGGVGRFAEVVVGHSQQAPGVGSVSWRIMLLFLLLHLLLPLLLLLLLLLFTTRRVQVLRWCAEEVHIYDLASGRKTAQRRKENLRERVTRQKTGR